MKRQPERKGEKGTSTYRGELNGPVPFLPSRRYMRQWLDKRGVTEDVDTILVNRRLYSADESEWTVPDIHFSGRGVILDGTIGTKTITTRQIRRFIAYTGGNSMIVIIRPNQPPTFLYIPTTP